VLDATLLEGADPDFCTFSGAHEMYRFKALIALVAWW
jgi:hypothetical protein